MRAGFPTPPEPTLGAHNLFILNYLLQYICKCAQTHKSTISKKMNLLYVVVDPGLYTHYSAGEAYPTNNYPFSDKVDEVPNFSVCNNNNNRATPKMTHAMLLKTRNNVVNMNAALIDTLVIGRLTMVLAGSLSRLKWRIMLKASHWSKQQWKLVTWSYSHSNRLMAQRSKYVYTPHSMGNSYTEYPPPWWLKYCRYYHWNPYTHREI